MAVVRISTWCALACKNPDFWEFLQVVDEESAVHQVRTRCGVASRAEFDRDPEAKNRLDKMFRIPFIEYTQEKQCSTSTRK